MTARLSESGSEHPARMRSCNDTKQLMDRHENHRQSTASTNEPLSEANCVNTSVMGDSWDKKPEDWVEEVRIVDAEAKKPEGAENESDKFELLLNGRLQTEITSGENCLDVESAEKLNECRGNQTALSMKQVWMTLHSLHSRIVSEVSTYTRPSCGPISARLIRKHCRTCQPSLEKVLGKEPDFLQSDGTDHVYDNTVSSVSSSFPGLELNVNDLQARIGFLRQEYSTKKKWFQGSLGSEGLHGEIRLSTRPHVTFWWFCVRCDERVRHSA